MYDEGFLASYFYSNKVSVKYKDYINTSALTRLTDLNEIFKLICDKPILNCI